MAGGVNLKDITIILLGDIFPFPYECSLCFGSDMCVNIKNVEISKSCKDQKCVFAESKGAFVFDIYKISLL